MGWSAPRHALARGCCRKPIRRAAQLTHLIADPVEASADGVRLQPWRGEELTLGAEIDKLAANIALARDAAGVHFRSDSIRGLKLGEEVAIGLLADTSRTYNEKFDGFVLSRFDGSRIRILEGAVHAL